MSFNFPSKLLEEAVNEFSRLPGIGSKTALRLVLYLLRQDEEVSENFGNAVIRLKKEIKECKICHNLSDSDVCHICSNPKRDHEQICVVESIRDVMSIENTQQYQGAYHVLGGIISPMEGIGPGDLSIESLEIKVREKRAKEIILALPTTMEGDTTNFYIYRKLRDSGVQITTLARGLSIGDDLEFADEITLGRSLINRLDFESTLSRKGR
ncbi:MAG: recombination protein RecR [Bacteroidales bacterium]|nr:recombination protein RecR [Bacteroidales bacterium]MCB8999756.1 recombination protein RecR [Bacteroidales bacterium]MCB9013434.1 recombination protein RecR [Bacteroidales bacterium]